VWPICDDRGEDSLATDERRTIGEKETGKTQKKRLLVNRSTKKLFRLGLEGYSDRIGEGEAVLTQPKREGV